MHISQACHNRLVHVAVDLAGVTRGRLCKFDKKMHVLSSFGAFPREAEGELQVGQSWSTLGNAHMEDIYLHGIHFNGTVESLYKDCGGASNLRGQSQMNHGYVAVLPIQYREKVYGALELYDDRPIQESQLQRAVGAVTLAEDMIRLERGRLHGSGARVSIVAEERFRQEVAEELHGPVQTKLFFIWNDLRTMIDHRLVRDDASIEKLKQILSAIDEVRDKDIRQLSHRIHPGIIRVALRPAIGMLVTQFMVMTQVSLAVQPRVAEIDTPLDNGLTERARLVAYRVIEESLSNAVRHGRAKRVNIELDLVEGHLLRVHVVDDGCGFREIQSGLGIQLMRSRVRSVNGELHIRSTIDYGTEVTALIPMKMCYRAASKSILQGASPHYTNSDRLGGGAVS